MNKRSLVYRITGRLLTMAYPYLPDRIAIKLYFKYCVGYKLNLENPQTYNEKLQWLKLNDIHPEYGKMVDKIEAKKYVAERIGEEYIIPTLAVYNSVEEIDWDSLPMQFAMKTNHGCGGMVICKDKNQLNIEEAKQILEEALKKDYSKYNHEYPYQFVKRRILVEQYMEDETGELRDFKFFCFDGKPYCLFVATDRGSKTEETKFDFYDMDWNLLPFTNGHPNSGKKMSVPQNFEKMKELASKLSKGIPHVRVDFYNINGKIYFGELTFFHWSGYVPFEPIEWDYKLGSMIKLPDCAR